MVDASIPLWIIALVAVIALAALGGITLLGILLANEKTRVAGLVLLLILIPLALVIAAGGVFLSWDLAVDPPQAPPMRTDRVEPAPGRIPALPRPPAEAGRPTATPQPVDGPSEASADVGSHGPVTPEDPNSTSSDADGQDAAEVVSQ